MILIQQISNLDLEYIDDIKECLRHNVLNPIIDTIVIFSNCKNFESSIKIDSRKIKYFEVEIDLFEMMKYGKKNSKNFIIYSSPFLKFGIDLKKVMTFDMENVLKEENCYYIFDKRLDIKNKRNIEDILDGQKLPNSLNLQKMGYYTKGFQYNSYDWKVSRTYKEKKVELISEKFELPKIPNKVEQKIIDIIPSKRVGIKKLDVVIVSVNYNDFLIVSLENNIDIFENITVVTSSSDFLCQKICEKFGVKCIVTDVMYENNAVFNKGKAINEGIRSIMDPDYILLLDADIVVMNKIDLDTLEDNFLYTSERYIVPNYDSYKRYIYGDNEKFRVDPDNGLGFFQLFNYSKGIKYSELFDNAAVSDIKFRDKFKEKRNIGKRVLHLGTDSNWDGRKSKIFLNYNEFIFLLEKKPFDINSYFDKIYCLNLDRRVDRWEIVDHMFKKNNINVERFSAIDGEKISDLEFSDTGLDEDQCSNKGLIENKNSLACLLSHLEIIKEAKLNNYKRILIFEDDVVFSKSFKKDISKIESYNWKLLYLGASQFDWENIEISNNHYKCRKTLGTFAYAIDSSIYDDIIGVLSKREKSIDNILSDIQKKYKRSSFVAYPNIVISDVSDSDIRKSKDKIDYAKIVRWDMSNFEFTKILKKVSIVIPCYNQSEFLIECIDSCLSQTVLPDSILVLLMDKKSISMKQLLKSKSKKIKCFISNRRYLSNARNYLIDKVDTEYFIPLDADDKIPSNFIEEISLIDADVVYVGSKYFGGVSGCWPNPITEEINWSKLTTFRRNSLVCTALIKKDSFMKSGRYSDNLWAFEDMDLWIKMYKNGMDFKKCNGTFLSYRKYLSQNSLLSKTNSDSKNTEILKKEIMKDSFYSKTPKIIHWVWLGKRPVPQEVIDTWYRNLPDSEWRYMMWNEENFDMESCDFLKKAYSLKKYGICVDYIRAKVLHDFGGIWLDADCVINCDISPFLQWDFFASWENESYLNIGLIGCSPNLVAMKNILDYYTDIKVSENVLVSNHSFVKEIGTGPMVLTREILKIEDIMNGGFSNSFEKDGKRYLIETPDVFVLDDSENGHINYAVHLFDGSWTDKKEEWSVVVRNSYDSWKIKNRI